MPKFWSNVCCGKPDTLTEPLARAVSLIDNRIMVVVDVVVAPVVFSQVLMACPAALRVSCLDDSFHPSESWSKLKTEKKTIWNKWIEEQIWLKFHLKWSWWVLSSLHPSSRVQLKHLTPNFMLQWLGLHLLGISSLSHAPWWSKPPRVSISVVWELELGLRHKTTSPWVSCVHINHLAEVVRTAPLELLSVSGDKSRVNSTQTTLLTSNLVTRLLMTLSSSACLTTLSSKTIIILSTDPFSTILGTILTNFPCLNQARTCNNCASKFDLPYLFDTLYIPIVDTEMLLKVPKP